MMKKTYVPKKVSVSTRASMTVFDKVRHFTPGKVDSYSMSRKEQMMKKHALFE